MRLTTTRPLLLTSILLCGVGSNAGAEPVGTEFTYQGQLKAGGIPADGEYDFLFRLYEASESGTPLGSEAVVEDLGVFNGLFTVTLDFGSDVFGGDARWLEVSVRPGASSGTEPYTLLSPRQPITATPFALYALGGPGSGGNWTLSGGHIFNNNTGYVGVGTASPQYNLHVYRDGSVGGNFPPARLGIQRFVGVLPPGTSLNDWFAIETGGSGLLWGPGTKLVREVGTSLLFQTEETMSSAIRSTQMTLDPEGKLGIGTTTPISLLEVETAAGVHGIRSTTPYIAMHAHRTGTSGTWPAIHAECDSASSNASAIRAYITSTSAGAGSAAVRGVNNGHSLGIGVSGTSGGSGYGVYGDAPSGRGVYGRSDVGVGVYGSSNTGYAGFFQGRVSVNVLEITGADLAEKFPASERAEPGMVVAIDPKNPGHLRVARGAYNRRVAGVVSGANGLPAGAVLGQLPGSEDAPAVALSGRVWVRCDATDRAIDPGDLLTTAEKPGHAMAVSDYRRAQGAIIGKAMTALESGHGMVLVLVSLQ